jgi:hypothetical protein
MNTALNIHPLKMEPTYNWLIVQLLLIKKLYNGKPLNKEIMTYGKLRLSRIQKCV